MSIFTSLVPIGVSGSFSFFSIFSNSLASMCLAPTLQSSLFFLVGCHVHIGHVAMPLQGVGGAH